MKLQIDRETAFGTKHEIEFIDSLGIEKYSKLSTVQLLKNYIASIKLRKSWGEINRQEVINYATEKYLNATK